MKADQMKKLEVVALDLSQIGIWNCIDAYFCKKAGISFHFKDIIPLPEHHSTSTLFTSTLFICTTQKLQKPCMIKGRTLLHFHLIPPSFALHKNHVSQT